MARPNSGEGLHIAIGENCQYQILWLLGDSEEILWITADPYLKPVPGNFLLLIHRTAVIRWPHFGREEKNILTKTRMPIVRAEESRRQCP